MDIRMKSLYCILGITLLVTTVVGQQNALLTFCQTAIKTSGIGYYKIPGYCNIFVQCSINNPQLQTCASGTFFDGNVCRHASDVTCNDDPCKRLANGTQFTDGGNCFGYYECRQQKAHYLHCPIGHSFNKTKCVTDAKCLHPVAGNVTETVQCPPFIQPNLQDQTSYGLIDETGFLHPMKCPPGLVFRNCVCAWPDDNTISNVASSQQTDNCHASFEYQFNGDFSELKKRVYMSVTGPVYVINNRAYFENRGQANVPYFKNVKLDSNFAFSLNFKYNGNSNSSNEISLLSNELHGQDFTYRVSLKPALNEVHVALVLTNGEKVQLLAQNVDPNVEHRIRLGKFGDSIKLQIDNDNPVTLHKTAGVEAIGNPLVLGSTNPIRSFEGYMDNFSFFRCLKNDFFSRGTMTVV